MTRGRLPVVSAGDRLAELPFAAVMCRDLRHAWPRTERQLLELVELEPTLLGTGGRIIEGVRTMWCTGRCGVKRVDKVRRNRHGRLERIRKPRLVYPDRGYLLAKAEPGKVLEPVGADVVRDAVLRRMFPDLAW